MLRVAGTIASDQWNRLGTRLVPKLRTNAGDGTLKLEIDFSVTLSHEVGTATKNEIAQMLADLGLDKALRIDLEET
ncbi:MAG TPA: hypothetical protein VN980_02935 [Alphaproteobacteria bacterium]|nr:hypothetical protein [Alphaproteobacteria bacterium]